VSRRGQILVLAKAPRSGQVKTRLIGPLTSSDAAAVAEACLHDTLTTASSVPGMRTVLCLADDWDSGAFPGLTRLRARGAGLAERLANAMFDAWTDRPVPTIMVCMDTPQVTVEDLEGAASVLTGGDASAVLGPAVDGGYWLLGLREVRRGITTGVPMSTPRAFAAQRARLQQMGYSVATLRTHRDVDTFEDAIAVRREVRRGEFARVWDEIAVAALGPGPASRTRG
jgi:rSAM/selenodomain-associated transferase 1